MVRVEIREEICNLKLEMFDIELNKFPNKIK